MSLVQSTLKPPPRKKLPRKLWEILVPATSNGHEISVGIHRIWDNGVREIAGGLTIYKSGIGEYVSPTGNYFRDRIIPVRISCDEKEIVQIMKFTKKYYKQESVFAYLVSELVLII